MNLREAHGLLADRGLISPAPDFASTRRFAGGAAYRVEIPSCEGPAVMRTVLDEAAARGVTVHRVSQGSGVMMLTDGEIDEMLTLGADHEVEVCLFLGPRGAWDTGGQAKVSAAVGGVARGNDMVAASLCDAYRAVELGVRSLLVGDLGVLELLGLLKKEGELPADLVLKTSVLMPLANASTAALYERLGATSLNVSTDLPIGVLAEIRAATTVPIDMYVEVPDDQGGHVRFYDVPAVVRVAAPVYLKMGLRNAPNIYPAGAHLAATAEALGRERVRRAELVLRLLAEQDEE
ncbi:U32 family peptidase [Kribbella sp. CA-293567]|uniref:U32 family peptidase n=1 Tax=Kribbella sp. CA-293567 TaxID=3002436 RepID=UPI0022DDB2B2|nr:U32 family peptidase [Kribbella sp. CA-293567]WBQ05957.1 U32 family peptidase [Kribbella sp. CA-293567]